MMQNYRQVALVCIMATGLALAGCENPPDNFSPPGEPVDPPVSEQVDVVPEQKKIGEPAPLEEKEKTRKPLDLSLPPEPAVVPGSRDNSGDSREHILPDMFQQEHKPADDDGSMHLKGRVLMKQGEEQNLDSLEGGEVIFEIKTR